MTNEQQIRNFLVASFLPDVDGSEIDADLDLLESGVIDSLGLLTLISWLEDHFGIAVEDDDLSPERFSTIASILAYIEGARAHQATAGS